MKNVANERAGSVRRSDMLVALVSVVMLGSALLPALAQTRDDARMHSCISNAKMISIAIANYESARRTIPLASTQPITAKPAHAGDADAGGFSWLTMLLLYLQGEPAEYHNIVATTSDHWRKPPFDPTVTAATGGLGRMPGRDFVVKEFLCPSFVDALPGMAVREIDKAAPLKLPAISNYHVLAGTHFFNRQGLGRLLPEESLVKGADGRVVPNVPFEGNGAMPFPGMTMGKLTKQGVKIGQISDGTSQTVSFGETIEPQFAAWIDGQVTWMVAAWPSTPDTPTLQPTPPPATNPNQPPLLGWTAEQLPKNFTSLGKEWSPDAKQPTPAYLPANRWSGGKDRVWGPSSHHGKQVVHAFLDAHATGLSTDIDKVVYLHLVTRGGREVAQGRFEP